MGSSSIEGKFALLEPGEAIPSDPFVGRTIAKQYVLLEQLKLGGMTSTYRARHLQLNKEFALKMVTNVQIGDESSLRRFHQEAKALSSLAHEAIALIRGFGVDEETQVPFLAFDLVKGTALCDVIKEGALHPKVIVEIAVHVASALAHAHRQSIIHYNLNPANIIVLETPGRGPIKIVDFGINPVLAEGESGAPNQRPSQFIGASKYNSKYMSPEQCMGRHLDGRANIYSFGCILYEAFSGNPPFDAATAKDIMVKHLYADPAPCRLEKSALSLYALIHQCLEKNPEERYQTAEDLLNNLERVRGGEPVPSLKQLSAVRRMKQLTIAIAVITLILISGILALSVLKPVQQGPLSALNFQIKSNPKDAKLYLDRAQVYYSEGKIKEAIGDLDAAARLAPSDAQIYVLRSRCKRNNHDYAAALSDAEKAVGLNSKSPAALLERAKCHSALKQYEKALADCSQVLSSSAEARPADLISAYTTGSSIKIKQGRFMDAVQDCDNGLRIHDKALTLYTNRAAAYFALNHYDICIDDCNKAIALDPEDKKAFFTRARAHWAQKDYEGALNDFEQALLLADESNKSEYYESRARLHHEMSHLQEALDDCNAALACDKYNSHAWLERARIHKDLGDTEKAIRDAKLALKIRPDFQEARTLLGGLLN